MLKAIHRGRVTVGLVILGAGLVMLLNRTGAVAFDVGRLIAPGVLVALGLTRLASGWGTADARWCALTGLWFIMLAGWMIVSDFHLFGLSYRTSWPLVIVAAGVVLVLQELTGARGARPGEGI